MLRLPGAAARRRPGSARRRGQAMEDAAQWTVRDVGRWLDTLGLAEQ